MKTRSAASCATTRASSTRFAPPENLLEDREVARRSLRRRRMRTVARQPSPPREELRGRVPVCGHGITERELPEVLEHVVALPEAGVVTAFPGVVAGREPV